MALAEVGIQVRALDAAKAKSDIAAVRGETDKLVQADQRLAAAGQEASRAITGNVVPITRGTAAMARYGQAATNASFQIQDFAVQVASGQSAMMAFAQQAPQFLGAFGFVGRIALLGSLAGTAIAVLAAVVPKLVDMGNESKSASDRIDDLGEAMDRYKTAADAATMSTEDLREKYGDLAGAVRAALVAQMDAAAYDARKALSDALTGVGADFQNALDNLGRSGDRLSFQAATNAARILADDFKLSADEAARLKGGFDALEAADGPAATARAASSLQNELLAAYGTMQDMPPAVAEIYRQLSDMVAVGADLARNMDDSATAGERLAGLDMASGISAAADQAIRMAEAMGRAALNYGSIGGVSMPGMGSARLSFDGSASGTYRDTYTDGNIAPNSFAPTSSNRPQRRSLQSVDSYYGAIEDAAKKKTPKSEAQKEAERLQKEMESAAEGFYKATRTPLEEYAETIRQLNDLKKAGFFGEAVGGIETFNRAVKQAKTDLDEATNKLDPLGQSFKDMLDGMMTDADNAGDYMEAFISSVLKRIIGKMMDPQVNILSNAASTFLSGLLPGMGGAGAVPAGPSFDGGGYTGNGSRTGGVDGKGGFNAVLHPRETVIDHTKGQTLPGGGGGRMTIEPSPLFNVVMDDRALAVAAPLDARMAKATAKSAPRLNADNARRRIRS